MRTLTYFVALTLDGFVCAPDGAFDFFPESPETGDHLMRCWPELVPSHLRPHFGVDAPNRNFDTMVQGRGSYQVGLDAGVSSPYGHMREYVFSRSLRYDVDPNVTVVASDPLTAVRELKQEEGGLGICLVGGPTIAGVLLPEIDELLLKRYPVVAGSGRPLFEHGFAPQAFRRVESTVFSDGSDYTLFRRAR